MISLHRTTTILRKECMHILRDPFTLIFSLIMPLVMVVMFGAAIEFNVRNVPTDYLDQSHSQASRIFLNTLSSSGYFKTHAVDSPREGLARLGREAAKAFVLIPQILSQDCLDGVKGNCRSSWMEQITRREQPCQGISEQSTRRH